MRLGLVMLIAALSGCHSSGATGAPDLAGADLAAETDLAGVDLAGADLAGSTNDLAASGAFTILHSFDGDFASSATGRGKPEMNVAANGTQVAQVTWQNVNIYDYSGTLVKTTPLPQLITSAGLNPNGSTGFPFEPHIIYDEFIQRWVITATCSLDCVLVSDGADPTSSNWKGFYLDNYGNDPSIHLGYDKNGVYFSEVVLTNPNPDTPIGSTTVFAIPAAELQWTTTLNPAHRNKTVGKPIETMIVTDHDPTKLAGAPAFFIGRTCPSGNSCQGNAASPITNQAFRWIISYGTWSGSTFTVTSNHTSVCAGGAAPADQCIRTDPNGSSDRWLYNTPIDPNQPGTATKLRAAEIHRVIDAMQVGTHAHVVMGSGPCGSSCGAHGTDSNADIFLWADFDCSTLNACTLSQTQKVALTDHLLWPSIAVDPSGNVGIIANTVNSTTKYLSIEAFSHHAADAPGVLSGPTPVIAGTTSYTCSLSTTNPAQTGNPVGVSSFRDPLDPTALWVSQQYANDSGDCHWRTRIIEYRP
jgi:hypothetical protein